MKSGGSKIPSELKVKQPVVRPKGTPGGLRTSQADAGMKVPAGLVKSTPVK